MALTVVQYDVLWQAVGNAEAEILRRSELGDPEARLDLKYLDKVKDDMSGTLREFCNYDSMIKSVIELLKKWETREPNRLWKGEISGEQYQLLCDEENRF
ncbi:MAG: hypothetical protein ACK5LP_10285 [Campylobacteraceae bacterium]